MSGFLGWLFPEPGEPITTTAPPASATTTDHPKPDPSPYMTWTVREGHGYVIGIARQWRNQYEDPLVEVEWHPAAPFERTRFVDIEALRDWFDADAHRFHHNPDANRMGLTPPIRIRQKHGKGL